MSKKILTAMLLASVLTANQSTLTDISFNADEDGNLNPSIFIPIYYGKSNQFYSAIGYSSSNRSEVEKLSEFSDSKNAFISSSKDLNINYLTYKTKVSSIELSLGFNSTFTSRTNNEFGYIHDSDNQLGEGTDYYISFDNEIELDIYTHAINADIMIPIGERFKSRFSLNLSPYSTIGVKQSTLFKPLVEEIGSSDSSQTQDLAYKISYDLDIKTGVFFDIGLSASYNAQSLKYDIATLGTEDSNYVFKSELIDMTEVTTSYMVRLIFNKELLGDLKPSIGFGIESLEVTDNITKKSTSEEKTIFSFGFEKKF